MLRFEWDERKNAINIEKHRVSFEEAKTVFYDENAVMIADRSIQRRKNDLLLWALASGHEC